LLLFWDNKIWNTLLIFNIDFLYFTHKLCINDRLILLKILGLTTIVSAVAHLVNFLCWNSCSTPDCEIYFYQKNKYFLLLFCDNKIWNTLVILNIAFLYFIPKLYINDYIILLTILWYTTIVSAVAHLVNFLCWNSGSTSECGIYFYQI